MTYDEVFKALADPTRRALFERLVDDEMTVSELRAGTPVEVMIPTKARSALDYLVGPLLARVSKTFAEQ